MFTIPVKHSIRTKIAIIVFVSTAFTIVFAWLIVNKYVARYYINKTKTEMVSTYQSCNVYFNNKKNVFHVVHDDDVTLYNEIQNLNNAAIYVAYPRSYKYLISYNFDDEQITNMGKAIKEYDFRQFDFTNKNYRIYDSKDGYYELIGILDSGYLIVIRTSEQNVNESITFAARLFSSVSAVLLMLEVVFVLIVTNSFSKPIIEMSRVAKQMSKLNFNAKVEVKSNDEIGDLGRSMNELSSKLQYSISELKEANLQLSRDIKKKEELEEMRSEFLSHVSHELKTPIALIQGYSEGLKEGVIDDKESRDYYCDVIIDEAAKMNALVMRLINLNELEYGNSNMTIDRFDITSLIRDIINAEQILVKQSEAKVEFNEEEAYVWADEFMIEDVITNYITNAIHYVKKGGQIRIWYDKKENDILRVNVFNEGDLIEEKDINKLFIKFYKADEARTREYGGSGIGLSIVSAIMHAHNRDFGVYNAENGVVFYFEVDAGDSFDTKLEKKNVVTI